MTLSDRLASATTPATESGFPSIERLDAGTPAGRARLGELLDGGTIREVRDTLADQLAEAVRAREPNRRWTDDDVRARVREEVGDRDRAEYGRWVHYPWSGRLVHVLPPDAFRRLRSDRNRNKITAAEQDDLRGKTVAIAGLSVGLSVALTMALEGVGGSFRLADFDALGVSNLNRLRAGVHDLGVNKAVLAARQMWELDPYLDIVAYPGGVKEETLDDFLAPPLDLLVEECDDLYMKVRLREEARRRLLPVLMETSDRGVLDVERFDREPDRPLFHGRTPGVTSDAVRGLKPQDRIPFVLAIMDAGRISAAGAASLLEIGNTLSTWPQLGSAVTLGGALVTDAARRIFLNRFNTSGRYYVDLEQLVREGSQADVAPPPADDEPPVGPEPLPLPPRPAVSSGPVTREEIRYVVFHGTLAPSGGNTQPWRYRWRGGRLECRLHQRGPSFLEFADRAAHLAHGAAVENMVLAAGALGLRAEVRAFPDSADRELVAEVTFDRAAGVEVTPDLFPHVSLRMTNRRHGSGAALAADHATALRDVAAGGGASLQLVTDPAQRVAIGAILGRGDRVRVLNADGLRGLNSEVRWTTRDTRATSDGIDVRTLEGTAADRVAMALVTRPDVADELRRTDLGHALGQMAVQAARGAAAVGLLTMARNRPEDFLTGGRVLQRVWLTAAARGVGFQPWSCLPYLFARLENGAAGLTHAEARELATIRTDYNAIFSVRPGEAEVMVFLLTDAGPATARSLRLPVEAVFEEAP